MCVLYVYIYIYAHTPTHIYIYYTYLYLYVTRKVCTSPRQSGSQSARVPRGRSRGSRRRFRQVADWLDLSPQKVGRVQCWGFEGSEFIRIWVYSCCYNTKPRKMTVLCPADYTVFHSRYPWWDASVLQTENSHLHSQVRADWHVINTCATMMQMFTCVCFCYVHLARDVCTHKFNLTILWRFGAVASGCPARYLHDFGGVELLLGFN